MISKDHIAGTRSASAFLHTAYRLSGSSYKEIPASFLRKSKNRPETTL